MMRRSPRSEARGGGIATGHGRDYAAVNSDSPRSVESGSIGNDAHCLSCHGHRLNERCRCDGHPLDPLWHDRNFQRLGSPSTTTEIGSIVGHHFPGRLLLLQFLHHDIGPSSQQYIVYSPAIDALVGDDDQSLMITAHQPSEADLSPLSPASNRPVANIA